MSARQVIIVSGLACAVGWAAKMLVMVSAGGPDLDSPAENAGFFLGLIGYVVLAATLGTTFARRRGVGVKVVASVAGVVVGLGALGLVQEALAALPGDEWWQAESAFVVAALAALVVVALALRGRRSEAGG